MPQLPPSRSLSLCLSCSRSLVAYIIPRRCSRGRYLYLPPCGSRGSEIEFSVSILRPLLLSSSVSVSLSVSPSFTTRLSPQPSCLEIVQDIAVDPRPSHRRGHPASVFCPRRADILSGLDRYADTMIFEFLESLALIVARVLRG